MTLVRLMYKKKIFFLLTFFGYVLTILAWTKCRLVTKHVFSMTLFHSCFFLNFSFILYLYNKFKLSSENYLLFIPTFMCIILFWRIIILSFEGQKIRILSAGLGMAWNRDGLSWNSLKFELILLFFQTIPSSNKMVPSVWSF